MDWSLKKTKNRKHNDRDRNGKQKVGKRQANGFYIGTHKGQTSDWRDTSQRCSGRPSDAAIP
jgi:hypothetical protein